MSVILITGASSGIGYQASQLLAKENTVYGGARHFNKPMNKVRPIALDVTNEKSCKHAIRYILNQENQIDVLINCAGYGSFGAVEEVPIKEARMQLNVNLLGIARLSQLVLPNMRENKHGRIINISSIAGRVPVPFGDWYSVSKYAVEALSSDMRIELAKCGVEVSLIEPGITKTPWGKIASDHLKKTTLNTAYAKSGHKMADALDRLYSPNGNATPPIKVAKKIVQAVDSKHPKPRYLVGKYSHLAIFAHAVLPTWLFDMIMRKI